MSLLDRAGELEAVRDVSAELNEAVEAARSVFEERLKPEYGGQWPAPVVAIHAETGEYAFAATSPSARRLLRQRQPDGYIVTMPVEEGQPEPSLDRQLSRAA